MRATYIPETGEWLTRFRADPAKVRVSLRRLDRGRWRVTVTSLVDGTVARSSGDLLSETIDAALAKADDSMPGVDTGMHWSYVHPWGELAA